MRIVIRRISGKAGQLGHTTYRSPEGGGATQVVLQDMLSDEMALADGRWSEPIALEEVILPLHDYLRPPPSNKASDEWTAMLFGSWLLARTLEILPGARSYGSIQRLTLFVTEPAPCSGGLTFSAGVCCEYR